MEELNFVTHGVIKEFERMAEEEHKKGIDFHNVQFFDSEEVDSMWVGLMMQEAFPGQTFVEEPWMVPLARIFKLEHIVHGHGRDDLPIDAKYALVSPELLGDLRVALKHGFEQDLDFVDRWVGGWELAQYSKEERGPRLVVQVERIEASLKTLPVTWSKID